ncbi:sulfatase-like hydrolase/transferase [Haloarchaeobius sp. DFWS5]|uniref:sulfatase-like hydrolase/transferase n=1 Tax=Haloarchaeobius sp. DFWS5 TaxID=3446114 RepID=UPI003EBE0CB3
MSDSDPQNIVLVTVDSLREDYCGFMGDSRNLTPNMDAAANDGLLFTNAISPGPATLDAMPGIFTGENVPDTEVESDLDWSEQFQHHLRARGTIAERLSRLGYETAAFTANPWTSREFGFDRGFDHFEDFFDETDEEGDDEAAESDDEGDGPLSTLRYGVQLARDWRSTSNMFMAWDSFYDDIVAWTEQASEPYFLWLFLVDVHMPYLPPSEFRRGTAASTYASNLWLYLQATGRDGDIPLESVFRPPLLRAYEDTISYTDEYFGRLTTDLDDDDPLFVVHADHGEGFGERGIYGHGPQLYRENVHVPLFVANGPSDRIDEPFSLTRIPDLLETLAADNDPRALTQPIVRTRNHDPTFAVRGRDWKYIYTPDEEKVFDLTDGEVEVIDDDHRSVGRDVVTLWRRDERERRDIADAAKTVAIEQDV